MNEFATAATVILTIIGTGVAGLMMIKSSIKEDIDHLTDIFNRRDAEQKTTNAELHAMNAQFHDEQRATNARMDQFSSRLDQLYTMFIDLLKEGKK